MSKEYIVKLILALCFTTALSSCEHEEILLNKPDEEIRSIGGFLSNNYAYTLFSEALEYTGLMDTLIHSPGEFTVLAPVDRAFNAIGIHRAEDFYQMDRDSLRAVLSYHILPFRLLIEDIPINQDEVRYETLSGERLYANRYTFRNDYRLKDISNSTARAMMVTFSGAEVENAISLNNMAAPTDNVADMVMSNGVIHSIVKLMKPYPDKTVQDWLAERPEYSLFVAGLKKFGLWDELAQEDRKFTVFAPNNEIFNLQGITESMVTSMHVGDYIGARLFGAYIFYDRQYFIKDYHFYLSTQDQFWLVDPVRGDETYNRIFMGQALFGSSITGGIYQPSFAHRFLSDLVPRFYDYDYTLGVSKETTPYLYFKRTSVENEEAFLGGGTVGALGNPYMNRGLDPNKHDHLCKNGVVHNIDAVLVLPEEALATGD